jgi:hypothetical protein
MEFPVMQTFTHPAALRRAARDPTLPPAVRAVLALRLRQTRGEEAHFHVAGPGDDIAVAQVAVGWPLAIDGERQFEWSERHPGGVTEVTFVLSDDAAAQVLLVPDGASPDPQLHAAARAPVGRPGAEANPLEGVRQRDPNNRVERYLNPAETRRLQRAVDESENPMLKYIVALLLLTGARKRELLDGRWAEIDLDRKVWRIPTSKTGKPRHCPLSEDAIAVLRQVPRYGDCPFIVPNPGTLRPFRSFFRSWDTARRAAGLSDVRVHDLRHSCASALVNSGQSLYVVAKVLGHAQTRTTERYAHLDSAVLLSAVNAASQATGTTWAADPT